MKTPSTAIVATGIVALTGLLLATLGAPHDRRARPPAPHSAVAPPGSVAAGGFTLTSAGIDLPDDDAAFPAGAGVDIVTANCTACHSASMATLQPPLSADQWKATVTKMRDVYKAPIADADVPAILAYLAAMPGQKPAAPAR